MTQQRMASSVWTKTAVRQSEVGAMSGLIKSKPEKYPNHW
jgi:hypothetical protein